MLRWTTGYSAAELERAQSRFGLVFPPDLIDLLRDRRPVGGVDWNDEQAVRSALAWPFEGLLFDVEENALWWSEWGGRPVNPADRANVLREVVAKAPALIPLIGHRYLPATPRLPGNPVFSVHQSDVIFYGVDLADYLDREEHGWSSRPWSASVREIPFWSEMVRRNT